MCCWIIRPTCTPYTLQIKPQSVCFKPICGRLLLDNTWLHYFTLLCGPQLLVILLLATALDWLGGANHSLHAHVPRQSHLETKRSSYNEYMLEEKAKIGRYGAKNGLSKVTKHFSLLLDGKLTCSLRHSGYIIFWLRDRIAKFKTCQILKKTKKRHFPSRACLKMVELCRILAH